ncbi:hypothetical protein ASPZODRAFT_14782 [Penicilliopsis zonata CBS 506.65]|uniref:Uncharacterized protein n=1 Tax=Penicilliopsis zonata CBS 506.65 TaxID=1073090 RepID=A0A1L9SNM1_9EURO|nr:hypothetical protein ASPZODRAFT_14782 [Penicilliopsis zonata CBS 506.65]OJJ48654.1 hypothetical protein ASPZODRAFT_14782 [Penicilliopsis zonata CBS 506.65]
MQQRDDRTGLDRARIRSAADNETSAAHQWTTLNAIPSYRAQLPNLRRLFVEARSEAEENEYSRTAFYNMVLFISSVAVFSLVAQRMSGAKLGK